MISINQYISQINELKFGTELQCKISSYGQNRHKNFAC